MAEIALSPNMSSELAGQLVSMGNLKITSGEVSNGTRVYACTKYDPVDASLIGRLPSSLELIAIADSETGQVDLVAARARGIKISYIPADARDPALSLKANIAAFLDRGYPLHRVG